MTGSTEFTDRYALAQDCLLSYEHVVNGTIYPRWLKDGDQFWYERAGDNGTEYRIVDARSGESRTLFALREAADLLGAKLGVAVDPTLLVLRNLAITTGPDVARFEVANVPWEYTLASGELARSDPRPDSTWAVSPDGKLAVLRRDHNLWLRNIASGHERALTDDGVEAWAYADGPLAARVLNWATGDVPQGRWSPDSRHFLTLRTDDRHVPDLPLLEMAPVGGGRPIMRSRPTSLPPDTRVTEYRLLSIEVATGEITYADRDPFAPVRMNDTPFAANLAWWSNDSRTAYVVEAERGEQSVHVLAFEVDSGETHVVLSESADTYVELGPNIYAPALVFPLPATDELVWYSERSGNGHLYLYDLATGALKHPITSGAWRVRDVQSVDAHRREIFLSAAGILPDEEPYTFKPCVVSIDNAKLRLLSAEPGDHIVWKPNEYGLLALSVLGGDRAAVSGLSPSGDYFVQTIASPDGLPRTILSDRSGAVLMTVEEAEDRGLPEKWKWPERVVVKAADGTTDIFGLLFKPPEHDPAASYPLIDLVYGGPQLLHTPKRVFSDGPLAATFSQAAAYAALGCFCLVMDGRGTAFRERAFRETAYGHLERGSNLEDHIAAIRQLKDLHGAIDIDRVGITGYSAGGFLAAVAALKYGDFFKVAVAASGNYDQSLFWHSWGERYQGPYSEAAYAPANVATYAEGMTGKLLLIHGLMDSGCHPAALFQLVQALIEQNKDPDLVLMPRGGHEMNGYAQRRVLDYFVRHLFGAEPPHGIRLRTVTDGLFRKVRYNATLAAPSQ